LKMNNLNKNIKSYINLTYLNYKNIENNEINDV